MTDNVNHPSHYQTETGLEAIEVIDAFFRDNAYLANVFKYIARAGKKGSKLEDLKKARFYLEREISLTEGHLGDDPYPVRQPRVWDTLGEIPFIGVSRVVDRDGDYYDVTPIAGEWRWQGTGEVVNECAFWSKTYGPFTEVLDV